MNTKIDHWGQIAEQWRDIGLTQKVFCGQQGVKLSTLKYWILRINKQKKPESNSLNLVRLTPPSSEVSSSTIVIEIDLRYRISLPEGFRTDTLRNILAAFS